MTDFITSLEKTRQSQSVIAEVPLLSLIIIFWNEKHYVDSCLGSLMNHLPDDVEIVAVDNGSSDGTAEYIEQSYPAVRVIRADTNLGFSGGNNLGVHHSQGEYLAFLNPDTHTESDWLTPLIEMLASDSTIGMVNPKILLSAEPTRINTCGLNMHYTGLPGLRGWLQPAHDFAENADLHAMVGTAFMMRRDLYEECGGLDSDFFPIYMEDLDLSWRVLLAGYRCVYVSSAIVYHNYTANFTAAKYYYLEKNRYRMLLKTYRWRTLLVLLPAFLLTEVVSLGFALWQGADYLYSKLASYGYILKHLPKILQSRVSVQHSRIVRDRETLELCSHHLSYRQISTYQLVMVAGQVVDTIFLIWYRVCLVIVRW